MASETKTGAHALLVNKSKPKVKIRSGAFQARQEATRSISNRKWVFKRIVIESGHLELGLLIVCLFSILQGHLVASRAYDNSTSVRDRPEVEGEQIRELVAMAARGGGGDGLTAASSELSFEYLNLRRIPSEQLCQLKFQSQVNSVSFASNQIKSIESSAFSCIGVQLKILNLRSNKIEMISEEAFKGLGQLQVLVLEGNQLKALPWKQLAESYAPSLRHLNLAQNQISAINASEILAGPSLISLNLRGNPLQRIHRNSLSGLAKLKTLVLSQIDLQADRMDRFEGLPELSFAHLDQLGSNLSSLDGQFCESSRKLATLSLKLNQLEQVPQFTSCQGLLSLDLSYNRLRGALAGNFSGLSNLIDLFLGHNQLEHLHGDAFVGLDKLQVLELNSNRIKTIHPNVFVPLRATLYELNIAHNIQLSELAPAGLERLISLKSYGNTQLRKLPAAAFPSARLLVLTFAYHCCDYYNQDTRDHHSHHQDDDLAPNERSLIREHMTGSEDETKKSEEVRSAFHHRTAPVAANDDDEQTSVMTAWSNLVLSKLARIWPASFLSQRGGPSEQSGRLAQPNKRNRHSDDDTASSGNMSELVLWRRTREGRGAPVSDRSSDEDEYFRDPLNLQQRPKQNRNEDGNGAPRTPPEAGGARQSRRERAECGASSAATVIDELIWQTRRIRAAHLRAPAEDRQPIGGPPEPQDDETTLASYEESIAEEHQIEANDVAEDPDEAMQIGLGRRADLVARTLASELLLRYSTVGETLGRPSKRAAAFPDGSPAGQQAYTAAKSDAAGSPRRPPSFVQCLPKPDALQPCRDLFDSVWLRASISLVFFLALAGNILVIVVLGSVKPSSSTSALTSIMWFNAAQSKRHIDVPRFLVINLAVADLLMAVYLGLLAFIDLSTLGEFRLHAIKWQYSTGCKIAGFLAVLSSELSVFILAVITLERNYAITNAVHLNRRLSLQKAMVIMFFGYLYALAMAILPLNGINDYRKFSICLPLDFDANNWRSPASLYLITLISINTLSFVLLLSCYLRMYCAIRGSQAWTTNDLKIAKRMSILVVTDFLCWSPIICVTTLALFGYYLVGVDGLKVLIIFVLPLNSVANPFLYAITTKKFKRDLATLKKRLRVEQTLRVLSRTLSHLAPNWRGHGKATPVSNKHQSASLTVRGGPDTGLDQIGSRSALRGKLKRSPTDYRLVFEETHAGNDSKQRAKLKQARGLAPSSRQELVLVNRNGCSAIAHGIGSGQKAKSTTQQAAATTRLIQLRTAVSDQLEQAGVSDGFVQEANRIESSRLVVTHCAACSSRIVLPAIQTARPLELKSMTRLESLLATTHHQERSSLSHQRGQGIHHHQLATRPRIVLDSAGPAVELEVDDLNFTQADGLECGNRIYLAAGDINTAQRSWSLRERGQQQPCQVHMAPRGTYRKFSVSDTIDSQRQVESINDESQKRASSADKPQNAATLLQPSMSSRPLILNSKQVASGRQQLAHEDLCPTVIVRGGSAKYGHNPSGHLDLGAPSNRSVSACAFEWPKMSTDIGQPEVDRQSNYLIATADTTRACCSCSCDTIRGVGSVALSNRKSASIGKNNDKSIRSAQNEPRGSSRSFSKLVVEPLAKAWSSLQLSLQLGPATTTTTSTRLAPTATTSQLRACQATSLATSQSRLIGERNQSAQRLAGPIEANRGMHELRSSQSSTDESDQLLIDIDEGGIIEDVLLMSSPKRRKLLKGRRMSRSCDVIVETSVSSSTTAVEPSMSSSMYDQNDDQRILLATINQLHSRRCKRGKRSTFEWALENDKQTNQIQRTNGGRRTNCTRCRSWSPALLDKLEDCMHQIKNKIPKFKKTGHQDKPTQEGTSQAQQGDLHTNPIAEELDGMRESTGERQSSCSSSRCSSSLNLSEEIDDEEEDGFNEVGLDDWTRNMQKKAPPNCYSKSVSRRYRLRQQLSANSDSLSARTVGTTLTSVSFDSSSSIPVNVAGSMEDTVHQVVSLSPSEQKPNNDAQTGGDTHGN